MIIHPFAPVYDADSEVLILGTMASPKSRELNFYYAHPQNRFWRVIEKVTGDNLPVTFSNEESIAAKKALLLRNHIALWDVLHSCDIEGSSDSSIKNPVANDFTVLLANTRVTKIFTNGKAAHALYKKLCENQTGLADICLPSTSPANAGVSFEELAKAWSAIGRAAANM